MTNDMCIEPGAVRRKIKRHPGYAGKRCWRVQHPEHGITLVYAPSWQTAIVNAAEIWKENWKRFEFYSNCKTTETDEAGGSAYGYF